jgi:prophage maintenance system killer protein
VFLRLNGRRLVAPGPELYGIVMAAATGAIGVEKVAEWLKKKVK